MKIKNGNHAADWRDGCPPADILADFLDEDIGKEDEVRVAAHLLHCEQCREFIEYYSDWKFAGEERLPAELESIKEKIVSEVRLKTSLISLPTAWREAIQCLLPRREYLAAAKGQNEDDVHHENIVRCGFINFHSIDTCSKEDAWAVKVVIPVVNPKPNTQIEVQVANGDGSPVDDALLKLFGLELPVREGYATLTVQQFSENCICPMISLKRKSKSEIDGTIVII